MKDIRLTSYSHGAGCGCKISPEDLGSILHSELQFATIPELLVGNQSRDDAAVYRINDEQAVISTTDFFMPIVDDPLDFGRIAAANAISDIYAMGGRPLMAIAILGWPLKKLPAQVAGQVVDGGRLICQEAGIPLAGGHSIDAPEPIFGLAVTGLVHPAKVKHNDQARVGHQLLLSKPLGTGVLSTAQKNGKLLPEHANVARDSMVRLNRAGQDLADLDGISAMTDVTGFGLLGHLHEVCTGSGLAASIDLGAVPVLEGVRQYIDLECTPGGTWRNWQAVQQDCTPLPPTIQALLCDPQTSGGLLIAVDPAEIQSVRRILHEHDIQAEPIGELLEYRDDRPRIEVRQ